MSANDPERSPAGPCTFVRHEVAEPDSPRQLLAIAGLVIGILAWLAFGIWFVYSYGDVSIDDPAEFAWLVAQQRLITNISGSIFLFSLPLAAWIAGRTYLAHKVLSLLTAITIFGLAIFLIGLFVLAL